MTHEEGFVPAKEEGKNLDLEFTAVKASVEEAADVFQNACSRLLMPQLWHQIAGIASATFRLSTPGNSDPERALKINDYVSINIPGPGNILGDGADWVKVEDIRQDFIAAADESFGLTLRACANPGTIVAETAHFFDNSSTSSFIVQRNGTKVTVNYYGRNEKANTGTESVIDNIRNAIVAAGAAGGFSNLQWSALCKGLLADHLQ